MYRSRFADENRFDILCEMTDSENSPMEVIEQKIRAMSSKEADAQNDSMMIKQRRDVELGAVVNLRLLWEERPSGDILSRESELTKKLALKWDRLEVRDGLVSVSYTHLTLPTILRV